MRHRIIKRRDRLSYAFDKVSREAARAEQNNICLYCHEPLTARTATREHRLARKNGGTDHQSNIGATCEPCNKLKGHLPEGKFKNAIKHPKNGDPLSVWMAWSRRRLNLAVERTERNIGRAMGWNHD